MRHLLFVMCAVGCAATAAAQDSGPRPFITAELTAARLIDGATRSTSIGFDASVGGPSVRGFQLFGEFGQGFGVGNGNPASYATGGVRHSWPSLWRFRPYVDTGAGVARMAFDGQRALVPLFSVGAGSHVRLTRHFTLDAGYRIHRFFGDADGRRAHPTLGLGVTF
jgi:opacity protein-like surface antigen